MKSAKVLTGVNLILCCLFWLLGIVFFILNVTNCWELWQAIGFLGTYYLSVPVLSSLIALTFCIKQKAHRLVANNLIALAVTVGVALFSYFISANYG